MPGVTVKSHEPFEVVLRRFKRQCAKDSVITEVRKRQFYEKPSIKKKKKSLAAKKRVQKFFRESY